MSGACLSASDLGPRTVRAKPVSRGATFTCLNGPAGADPVRMGRMAGSGAYI